MKFSEVTIQELKDYARVDSTEEDAIFQAILLGAKSHVRTFTGLEDGKLDELADTTIALYVIANEMYENRVGTDPGNRTNKFNELLDRILGSHSINLL